MLADLPQGVLKHLERENIPFTVIPGGRSHMTDLLKVELPNRWCYQNRLRVVRDELNFLVNAFDNDKQTA